MSHPDIAGTARVSSDAFTQVWQPLGWVLVGDGDPGSPLPAAVRYLGTWDVGTYHAGDMVTASGADYVALQTSTNKTPATEPSFWEPLGSASGVTTVNGRAGAVVGLQEKIATVPTGLVADGAADDWAAIQTALDAVKAAGGGIVQLPAGNHLIKQTLWIGSKVTLKGAGPGATKITKPATVKSLLTANAAATATSVTVASATGFTVGRGIHVYDTANFEGWTSTNATITGVAGNVITFARHGGGGLRGAMQTARTATADTSFPLIRNDKASVGVCVRDLTLDQNTNASDPAFATADFTAAIINLEESYFGLFENIEFLNAAGDAYSDQAQDGATAPVLDGTNNVKTKNTIRGCRIRSSVRHGVHLGTGMEGAYVLGNEMTNCGGYGEFYCAFVTNTISSGNIVSGCLEGFSGIDDRDYGNVISGNVILDSTNYAIAAANAGAGGPAQRMGRLTITGNIIRGKGIYNALPDVTISVNTFDLDDTGGICVELTGTAKRCIVQGNVGRNGGGGSYALYLHGGADDCRVLGNDFSDLAQGATVGWSTGLARLVALGNHWSTMNSNVGWNFEGTVCTDCVIADEMNTLTTPITGDGSCVRLVYEGLGTNGANDPASAGDWNAAAGKRHNGRLVRWNSGGGEKVSIFNDGIGWTALN